MMPVLAPGDRLVVVKLGAPRRGDVVALRDPQEPGRLLVKRVASVTASGVDVRGDNPSHSRDSRSFGPVSPSQLVGKAVYRYFPPSRTGSLEQVPTYSPRRRGARISPSHGVMRRSFRTPRRFPTAGLRVRCHRDSMDHAELTAHTRRGFS